MKINNIAKLVIIPVIFSLLSGCFRLVGVDSQFLTPLQLQTMQTQSFPVSKERLFYAAMITLEGLGYQVKTANLDGGTITAESPDRVADRRFSESTMSVFVTETGESSASARINMVKFGRQVTDQRLYQELFDLISHNLFTEQVLTG